MPTESVICPICSRTIGNNAGLQSHMRSMHREEWRREQEAAATPSRGARPLASVPAVPPPSPSSNGVRWEEPPRIAHGRTAGLVAELTPLIVELRRRPNTFARIREYSKPASGSATACVLRKQFTDIEFVARKIPTGSAIWARYVEAGD